MITKKSDLVGIINTHLNLSVKEIDLVKLDKIDLDMVPDLYTHSWAGKYGHQAFLIDIEKWLCLESEGTHSENGRITAKYSAEAVGVQLARTGAVAGDVVFFYAHHDFNNEYRESHYEYFVLTHSEIQQIEALLKEIQTELL